METARLLVSVTLFRVEWRVGGGGASICSAFLGRFDLPHGRTPINRQALKRSLGAGAARVGEVRARAAVSSRRENGRSPLGPCRPHLRGPRRKSWPTSHRWYSNRLGLRVG